MLQNVSNGLKRKHACTYNGVLDTLLPDGAFETWARASLFRACDSIWTTGTLQINRGSLLLQQRVDQILEMFWWASKPGIFELFFDIVKVGRKEEGGRSRYEASDQRGGWETHIG